MGRSGYSNDYDDQWQLIKWRGMVASASRGKRGQQFFRDLIEALDALPEKVLISEDLQNDEGDVCALGAVALKRGMDMGNLDPYEPEALGEAFNIAPCLAQEVEYVNDEWINRHVTPQERWQQMREWAVKQIKENLECPSPK